MAGRGLPPREGEPLPEEHRPKTLVEKIKASDESPILHTYCGLIGCLLTEPHTMEAHR